MRTNVVLTNGTKLRAHFFHVRRSTTRFHTSDNFYEELETAANEAFSRGQIKNYNPRNFGKDCANFNKLYDSEAITVCELTAPNFTEEVRLEVERHRKLYHLQTPEISDVDYDKLKEQLTYNVMAVGFAFCSDRDQFNKARGRKIALSRAVRDLVKNGTEVVEIES